MKLPKLVLIAVGKLAAAACRLVGRDAGNFPGLALWTIDKSFLRCFSVDCPVIAVTGTNGKTSTTNYLNKIFSSLPNEKCVITNMQGNNLDTGIGSLLLHHCDMHGRIHADHLVLEVDESHVPVIFKYLKLETLVVLNFFRDQLDRNGEVETLILKVQKFLEHSDAQLVLNADDPNVVRLCPKGKKAHFFSVEKYEGATNELYEAGEGKFCPFCAAALEYEYYQYSHIGRFRCPRCGYGDVTPETQIKDIDFDNSCFKINGEVFTSKYMGIYHLYNLSAVYTAAKLYNVDSRLINDAFEDFQVNNGRMEVFRTSDAELLLNLAKNPVGANMTLRLLNQYKGEKQLLFALNDNVADGLDVSWIWDINFSIFNNVTKVVTSGTRAYDIAVRIKYSGYDAQKIVPIPDLDAAAAEIFSTGGRKFAIANYTAVQPTRAALTRYITAKGAH